MTANASPSDTISLRDRIRRFWQSQSDAAIRCRLLLLLVDAGLLLFFLASTFVEHTRTLELIDYALGAVLAVELLFRTWLASDRLHFISRPLTVVDAVVVVSLMAPALTENFVFLRVLRSLRLIRSYHVLNRLKAQSPFLRRNEAVLFSATNLLVFIFVVSAAVYALQVRVNPQIGNYLDAMYFTVTTLTTTGFGDIVLVGEHGHLLSVIVMIVGVSLFLRLIQTIFRPSRVDFECPDCGLRRHDADAVHCKHCGHLLHIPTDGQD